MESNHNSFVINFCEKLGIPTSLLHQDYALDIADPHRLLEFLQVYGTLTDDDEKRFVFEVICFSLDEMLMEIEGVKDQVNGIARKEWSLHKATVRYWTLLDSPESVDEFEATPVMRDIWNANEPDDVASEGERK